MQMHIPELAVLRQAGLVGRRTLKAGQGMEADVLPVRDYYVVEAGTIRLRRSSARAAPGPIRLLGTGDIFTFDCGEAQTVECVATADSTLLRIPRQVLADRSAATPALARLLQQLHETELMMILDSLCGSTTTRTPHLGHRIRKARPTSARKTTAAGLREHRGEAEATAVLPRGPAAVDRAHGV